MSFAVYLFFFFSYEVWEQLIMFMLLIERRVYFFSPYHNSHNVVIDAVPFIIVVSVSQCQAKEFDESVRD